jgi:iron complex outermembrane recepter protein
MFRKTKLCTGLMLACGGVLLSAGTPAFAQATQSLERVTVTGSNIKRTDTEASLPVRSITKEEIERSGKTNISEVLQSISSNNSGSIPGSFTNGFASGSTAVSLRGLGVNSTLVLVNGRRMASYGLADDGQRSFVDLNTIPLEIVERIEVLKDGASSIYGSDAIAGVVNIILRKDFTGVTLAADLGTSYKTDGNHGRLAATFGFGDLANDNYNAFVSAEYSKTDAIDSSSRPSYLGTYNLSNLAKTRGYYDMRTGHVFGDGSFIPRRSSPYGSIRNPDTLVYQPATACPETYTNPDTEDVLCVTDQIKYEQIQPETERLNLFGRGVFNLNADTQAYLEAGIFKSKTSAIGSPSPVAANWGNLRDNTTASSATIALPVGHPQNPFGAPTRVRAVTESVGGRNSVQDNQSLRVVAGVQGTAASWDYDTAIGYIETKLKDTNTGYLRWSVLQEGLASGDFRLGFDPMNPAYLARLSPTLERTPKNSVTFADIKGSRELTKLGGGALALALGAEVRREVSDTPALPYTFEGDIVGLGYSGFEASRTVWAVFGEVIAPVTKDLELSAALRHDRYSDYGSSTTPKLSFKYKAASNLAFRGSYAEGFRAPGPAENGQSSTAGYAGYLNVTSGNPDIKPEKAKSYNLGLVFDPTPTTSLTFDYYKVVRNNEILSADGALVVGAGQQNGTPLSTVDGKLPNSKIVYDEDGEIAAIFAPYINGGKTITHGFDVEARQRIELGDKGRVTATVNWNRIRRFARIVDGLTYEYAGTHGPFVLSSAAGTPKNRLSFDLTWDYASVSSTFRVNYVGSMRAIDHFGAPYDPEVSEGVSPPEGATKVCGAYYPNGSAAPNPDCRIPSFMTFDVFGRWNINKQLSVSASITNLLNKMAPWDPYTYGGTNYDPAYHQDGAVGRYFKVGAKYTF